MKGAVACLHKRPPWHANRDRAAAGGLYARLGMKRLSRRDRDSINSEVFEERLTADDDSTDEDVPEHGLGLDAPKVIDSALEEDVEDNAHEHAVSRAISWGDSRHEGCRSAGDPSQEWRVIRRSIRRALEDPHSGPTALFVHYAVIGLIIASTLAAILVTIDDLERMYASSFELLEQVFTALFTIEIVLRMWTAPNFYMYFSAPSNIVDILATVPWYGEKLQEFVCRDWGRESPQDVAGSLRVLRTIRLIRLLRFAKVARHSETMPLVLESLLASSSGLAVLSTMLGAGTVVAATAVYAVEADIPDGDFANIPSAMWWALTTITTVGYGDMVPQTIAGKCIGCLTMVGGTIIVSLSVATITTSFTDQYRHRTEAAKVEKVLRMRRKKRRGTDSTAMTEKSPSTAAWGDTAGGGALLKRIAQLEDETKALLLQLEGEFDHLAICRKHIDPQPSGQSNLGFSISGSMADILHPSPPNPHHEVVHLLLESLHSQGMSFFKAARSLTEHLVVAEQGPQKSHNITDAESFGGLGLPANDVPREG